MPYNPEKQKELYNVLKSRGYNEQLCEVVSSQLCTDWTATRMLGYLYQRSYAREEDIVDEMLAILSDREQIIKKKEAEYYQQCVNEIYRNGLE